VTAGTRVRHHDGGAAVVVMSERKAKELRLEPLATIRSYASAGVDPSIMAWGRGRRRRRRSSAPGSGARRSTSGELNEAFAAQSLGVLRELRIPKNGST